MKKFFYLSALSLGMMCSITACSDDDTTTIDAKNLDYTAENASSCLLYTSPSPRD